MTASSNDLFPPVFKADWIAQVSKDLKDPAAYESLRWHSPEGFLVEPFYTPEDMAQLPLSVMQAAQKTAPGWLNAPQYALSDGKDDAHRLALSSGADALLLDLSELATLNTTTLSRLLNGIKLSETPVFFQQKQPAAHFVSTLQTVAPYQLKGGLLTPPDETTAEAIRLTMNSPQFRTVCISGHDFHNAGATATQELAFVLARLVDIFDDLTEQGLPVEQVAAKTMISVSVGTSYFVEIAKLRALRVLCGRVMGAYHSSLRNGGPLTPTRRTAHSSLLFHTQTSVFYESTATPYTNLLRATTEAMAAVIGGCDVLTVRPFDELFASSGEFSRRIARNVSLLLANESYLNKVADPSAGSYYVETLTHQLAESAWALFLQVEEMGGLAKATDFVQSEIEQSYQVKVEAVREGKVLVGVTKFRVDEEGQTGKVSPNVIKSLLPNRRLAEEFE
jgi:methylmalonyl-CoA mutase